MIYHIYFSNKCHYVTVADSAEEAKQNTLEWLAYLHGEVPDGTTFEVRVQDFIYEKLVQV